MSDASTPASEKSLWIRELVGLARLISVRFVQRLESKTYCSSVAERSRMDRPIASMRFNAALEVVKGRMMPVITERPLRSSLAGIGSSVVASRAPRPAALWIFRFTVCISWVPPLPMQMRGV
ncbi:MAG: hypothetical protein LIR47_07210 [Spirochaetota bacterium]|nr:hypothetical protein [Spirochaetota bacterium]